MHCVSMTLCFQLQVQIGIVLFFFFFFSSRRRHTRYWRDWSSDVCSSDLVYWYPKWLIYLPPTMSPCETSKRDGLLEHPEEAFAYYLHEGVHKVVCQQKQDRKSVV